MEKTQTDAEYDYQLVTGILSFRDTRYFARNTISNSRVEKLSFFKTSDSKYLLFRSESKVFD